MEFKDLKEALYELENTHNRIDYLYAESEGVQTEEIVEYEQTEQQIINYLLENKGADMLGRWLKGLEDKKARIKDEKNALAVAEKGVEARIDYAKALITKFLEYTHQDKVKGVLYGFTAYTSVKTETNKELLDEMYNAIAEKALREAGIPEYITFKLSASVKAVEKGAELPSVFSQTSTPTIKFSKPKEAKEEQSC